MEAQNVLPYRREVEDEQASIASAAAKLLIKGLHRIGPGSMKKNEATPWRTATGYTLPGEQSEQERLEKMDAALAKIASIDNTLKVTVDDVLASQIPSLVQSPLDAAIARDRRQARITPIDGNGMSALSDREIAEIIEYGLEALPQNPTSADYANFASTRAARTEQMKRSLRPATARMFVTGPVSVA